MRILITGGTGFVGSAIVKEALNQGHEVAVLTRNFKAHLPAGVRRVVGSLTAYSWEDVLSFGPEVCIHSAWITTPGLYLDSPENNDWYEQSLQFLLRMPEAGVTAIYALGTCLEYEVSSNPLDEGADINPKITYARCKARLHDELKKRLPKGVTLCWLRLFYPYGKDEPKEKLVTMASRSLILGKKIILKSPHDRVDFICVSDVASAILTICQKMASGIVNIGSGESLTVLEIVNKIGAITGRPELIEWDHTSPRSLLGRYASLSRLRSIGWKPLVSIEEGLRSVVQHNRQQKES